MNDTPLKAFAETLAREGKSPMTIRNYLNDLAHFARWFSQTNGEAFAPEAITLLDMCAHKSHLLTVAKFKPATVNRRLAALAGFCRWAKAQSLIVDNPTNQVGGVPEAQSAPKALGDTELHRLLREVYKSGKKRDIAIVEVLVSGAQPLPLRRSGAS